MLELSLPLDCQPLWHATASREDGAHLNIVARDFWWSMHSLTLGCLLLLCAPILIPLSRCYQIHEQKKRQAYDERIWEVKRAYFSPLVFASTGGMGPSATAVFRKLASMLAD